MCYNNNNKQNSQIKKKKGQRPSPSLQTHQPEKEPKEMTGYDLMSFLAIVLEDYL